MINTRETAAGTSDRSILAGLGGKVTMIAVVPILLFAVLTVALTNITIGKFEGTIATLEKMGDEKADVQDGSIIVEERMLDILLGLNAYSQGHARMLLTGNKGLSAGVEKTRAQEAEKLTAYADQIKQLAAKLNETGILSGDGDASALDRKRLNYLLRTSESLPRLYTFAVDANKRSIDMVADGNVDGARNNFVFEEAARMVALTKTVNKSSEILKALVESATSRQEAVMEAKSQESEAEVSTLVTFAYIAIAVVVIALAGFAGWFAINRLSRPIREMVGNMTDLSAGNLEVEIPEPSNDEIGDMAKALEVFKDNALHVEAMRAEQAKEQEAKEARQRAVEEMIARFESVMAAALDQMAQASGSMSEAATSMTATAEQTSQQGQAVAAASTEAATNVQTVASASEELSASIQEVNRQVSHSAQIADNAVKEAAQSNESVSALVEMANRVGQVVGLITDIAEQTNLLALNATIEAARAGDAGKGFAVVASEVKNLANQTAKATEEISAQIGSMQEATREAVSGIQGVGKIIDEMNEISTSIASAMEEQDVTTQEIARNVQEAARGTQEVDSNISGVNQAAGETGQAATEVLNASRLVDEQSSTVRSAVETFLNDVKTA